MIRAVISDFGGVLTTPLIQSFLAYQDHSGITVEDLGVAMIRATERADGVHPLFELEKGRITEREFLDQVERELGEPLSEFRETWFAHLRPNEPMIERMRELKQRGLRMALLTNNVREWEPHWREKLPDVDEVFETIVDSAFVGMRKPERGIYELTLERLGDVSAEECVFVDDVDVNCEMARELGMQTVHFVDNEQALAELDELLPSPAA